MSLSKEFIILGCVDSFYTDRIFDLIVLIAKYHIFVSKVKNTLPNINVFVFHIINQFKNEKYFHAVNNSFEKFRKDWQQYKPFFQE